MRKTNYRVWDRIRKKMDYLDKIDADKYHWFFCSVDTTLMQYIGGNDKNGKPICEGDVVSYEDGEFSFTAIVVWKDFSFCFKIISPIEDIYELDDWIVNGNLDVEVIGDAYRNPELIAS